MSSRSPFSLLLLAILMLVSASSYELMAQNTPSSGAALFRSLIVPGWGHKYANEGNWNKGASFHTGLEVALWTGLIGSFRGESQVIQSYEAWASSKAGVDLEGRNRAFLLTLGNYDSAEDYREVLLRNRAWDVLDSVSGDDYTWQWESEDARNEYRRLRDEADSLDRRQTFLMISLLGNRLVSGFNALRSARSKQNNLTFKVTPIFDGQSSKPNLVFSTKLSF